jgi:alpha-N-acetylglucosamine transferase
MARKPIFYAMFFSIALLLSELEIVFQHRKLSKPIPFKEGQTQMTPVHDFPSSYPHASNNYAYAFLISNCDPARPETYRGTIYNILVSAQMLESQGSRADIVVMIKMAHKSEIDVLPAETLACLNAFPRVTIRYLPRARQIPSRYPRHDVDKLHILELTQYRRVMYLDSNVMPLCNLDYLFHLSEKGIFRENLVLLGDDESINEGFIMLRPSTEEFQHVLDLIQLHDSKPTSLISAKSVLAREHLIHFWVKHVTKSVSVFIGNRVENWTSSAFNKKIEPVSEDTLMNASKGNECPNSQSQHVKPSSNLAGQMWHFDEGQVASWIMSDSSELLSRDDAYNHPFHIWLQTLQQVKERLNVTSVANGRKVTSRPTASQVLNANLIGKPSLESTATANAETINKKYAYAFVLAGVDAEKPTGYRGILFSILVNAQALESFGSTADIVVLVQMDYGSKSDYLPKEDASYMRAYRTIVVHYIPRPSEPHSFYSSQFDKFRILELTQYSRIIYLDADVTPLCNLDYLFHMSEKGVFKENMLLAGNNEPSNGGFMMLRPREGNYEQVVRIIEARDAHILATSPNHTFDTTFGWGHVITPPDKWRTRYNKKSGTKWDFTTAYGNQGLMLYWTKYVKKDVSIFLGNEVDNWSPSSNLNVSTPFLEATLVDAIKGHECPNRKDFWYDEVTKPPYDLEGQMLHFWGKKRKPWMLDNVEKVLKGNESQTLAYRVWFQHLERVKQRLNIKLDVQKELRSDPALGSWTLSSAMKKILQRKHAYAFLLADVDPANPTQYRATMHSILVNVQILRFSGSTADVVVMVQMAHNSEWDRLSEKATASLKAYSNVVIHYLPKATRAPTSDSSQFEKFRVLELTQYRRVLYMDTDIMPICSLDYLFHLSEKGTFKENMILAGDDEPAKRGFMMLRPGAGEYQQLMSLLKSTFDKVNGWGHATQPPDRWRSRYNVKNGTLWNFSAASGDQGLLYYWVKYVKKSASLFIGNEVENWSSSAVGTKSIPVLESTLVDALKGYACSNRSRFPRLEHAKPPYDLEGQMWHFNGVENRPWKLKNLKKVLAVDKPLNRPYHMWFRHFDHVKRRLNISTVVKKQL